LKSTILLLLIPIAGIASAAVLTYEGDALPEELGWERVGTLDADRSFDSGRFVQFLRLGDWAPGPLGEADFYQRYLGVFSDKQGFFIEWRVETDAPSSILDSSGIPTVVSAAGTAAANYHFTITDARVQVWRSNFLPILLVDIEPGVPHTYRLELCGPPLCEEHEYAWYIDGRLGDTGVAEGPYPNSNSVLIWGARHYQFDNKARWDYLRYGLVPDDSSGDYDSDGVVTHNDFYFFHECLTNERPGINGGPGNDAGPGCRFADFDFDDDVDLFDAAEFQLNFATKT